MIPEPTTVPANPCNVFRHPATRGTGFLLVHGLAGTPTEVRFIAANLSRAGFPVECPLLYGHGRGRAELDASSWQGWYASIAAAHDRLASTCDRIVVGGISAGALLALHHALEQRAAVAGIVLYAPTLWPNGWAIPRSFHLFRLVNRKWLARWFEFEEAAPYGFKDERVRALALRSQSPDGAGGAPLPGYSGATILEFRWLVRSVMRRIGEVRQPTLIFHPRDDDQSDLRNALRIQRGLGGVVETVVLDDSYHMVTLDRQRGLVADRTIRFGRWLTPEHDRAEAAVG
jgi:carboxylesterase